jgi:hypothetical protein
MANLFGGHIGTASDGTTRDLIQDKTEPGFNKGTGRQDVMQFDIATADLTNADTVRIGTIQSDARILKVELFMDALGTSGSVDLGFAKTGDANDGATVEVDTFADGYDVSSTVSADVFVAATGGGGGVTITESFRGDTAWSLANQSSDPNELWDWMITVNNKGNADLAGVLIVTYATD